jgi:hypothetical protein
MQPVVLPFIVDDKASGPLAAIAENLEKVAKATSSASARVRNFAKTFTVLNEAVTNAAQTLNTTQFKKGNLNAYLQVMQATTNQLKAQAAHQRQLNAAQMVAARQQAAIIRANASASATAHKAQQAAIAQTAALQQKTAAQTAAMQQKAAAQTAAIQQQSAAKANAANALAAQRQARTAQIQARGSGGGGGGGGGGGLGAVTSIGANILKAASYGLSIVWKLTRDIVGVAKFLISIPGQIYSIGKAAFDVISGALDKIVQLTSRIIEMGNEFEKFQYSFASMLMATGDFEGVKNQSENIIASLEYANMLYEDMVVLAAELPGEAQDFMDAFLLALPSGSRVGLTDPQEFMELSSNVTAIGISLGHSALRAGNSLNQLLQGTTTKQNALTQKLLTSIGMATVQFNKLRPEERLAKIKDIVDAYGDGIESYKNTYDALNSTMLTHLKEIARIGTKPIFEHSKVALREINLLLERFGPTVTDMLWELSMDVLDYVVAIQNYLRPMFDDATYYIAVALDKSRGFFESFIEGILSVIPFIKQIGNAIKETAMKVFGYLGVKIPKVDVPKVVLGYPEQIENFISEQFKAHTPEAKKEKTANREALKVAYNAAMAIEPFIPKQMEQFAKAVGLSGEKVALFGKELKFEAERKEYEKRFLEVKFPYQTVGGDFSYLKKSMQPASEKKKQAGEYDKYKDVVEYEKGRAKPTIGEDPIVFYAGKVIASVLSALIGIPAAIESFYADLPSGIEVGLAAASQASQQFAGLTLSTSTSLIKLHDGIFGLILGFGLIKAAVLPMLTSLAGGIASIFGMLGGYFPIIGRIISAISAAGPIAIIVGIIGGFLRFMTYTEQFAIFMGELQLAGAELASALLLFGRMVGYIFDAIGAAFAGLLPGVMAFISGLASVLNVILFVVERVLTPLIKPFIAFIKLLASIFGFVFSLFGAMAKSVAWAIIEIYNFAKSNTWISSIIKGIGAVFLWFNDALGSLATAVDRVAGWMLGTSTKGLGEAKKESGMFGGLYDKALDLFGLDSGKYKPKYKYSEETTKGFSKIADIAATNFQSQVQGSLKSALSSGEILSSEKIKKLGEPVSEAFREQFAEAEKLASTKGDYTKLFEIAAEQLTLSQRFKGFGKDVGLSSTEFIETGAGAIGLQALAVEQQNKALKAYSDKALSALEPQIEAMLPSVYTEDMKKDALQIILGDIKERYAGATWTQFEPMDIHTPEAAKEVPKFAGKGLNNYQDFRNSRFSISQKFEEGFDPDRIAVAFTQDLSKIGEKRIQSGLSPLYTVR